MFLVHIGFAVLKVKWQRVISESLEGKSTAQSSDCDLIVSHLEGKSTTKSSDCDLYNGDQ